MVSRSAIVTGGSLAAGWRAVLCSAAMASLGGCDSLDALECQGASCADASARDAAADAGPGNPAIRCGDGGSWCDPASQECCVRQTPACVIGTVGGHCGGGTDVFCDDPSQCPAGGPCWICLDRPGGDLLGASCRTSDLVRDGAGGCAPLALLPLCHSSAQCEAGTTCQPLPVAGFPPVSGGSWFSACR